jgi:hypothetical protein
MLSALNETMKSIAVLRNIFLRRVHQVMLEDSSFLGMTLRMTSKL